MNAKTLQTTFLVSAIVACSVLAFYVFRPFLMALVLAVVFATVLYPLYRRVLDRMTAWPGLAALITILFLGIVIVGPLSFVAGQIADDAQSLYVSLSDGDASGNAKDYIDTLFLRINSGLTPYVPGVALSAPDLSNFIDQHLKSSLQWIVQNLGGLFSGATRFVVNFFIFMVALYYLLRDGTRLRKTIIASSPLADEDDETVFAKLQSSVNSVMRGSLTIAFIQGILTGIGFTIFGVPNGVLWGVVAAFAALIPGIGTSLVLIPGIAYLAIVGSAPAALGLFIWSFLAVGLIDNFLGPRLVGKGTGLHPLIAFLSVFGGLALFGPLGVLFGPLSISLLFALLSIHRNISIKESAC